MEAPDNYGIMDKRFPLTNHCLKNRTTVLFFSVLLTVMGFVFYNELPKESYPEIKIPQVYVGTSYPGNSPLDIEALVTRPLEKSLNTISAVEEINSSSTQDYSTILIEFPPDMNTQEALLKVKDAVDKAKSELPTDLNTDPNVFEFDFASLPILNINLSGDFELSTLNHYAEILETRIESFPEISKVDIRGVDEKEVQILLHPHKMDAVKVSFSDVEYAIKAENINMSGGDILEGGVRRSLRVLGEVSDPDQLKEIIVKQEKGDIIHLGEVADVIFDYRAEKKSYSRLNGQPVVSVDVIKRSGENLLIATDKIFRELERVRAIFPKNLKIVISNDQSTHTRDMVNSLENNIVSGIILVVLVLQFFLGTRNAIFVGLAIPLSMLCSFCILTVMGATVNMMVLFSLIMALGMLVDNGIVVTENIYRLLEEGKSILHATRQGVGEVAYPIITSTLTTLAAFLPLLFWPGIMGEFMKYLPITLIITLFSSLFVALVINPVLISLLMRLDKPGTATSAIKRSPFSYPTVIIAAVGLLCLALSSLNDFFLLSANILLGSLLVYFFNLYVIIPLTFIFRERILPTWERTYEVILVNALKGKRPYMYFGGTVGLLIFSFILMGVFTPLVQFFPINEPRLVNVFVEFPTGADIEQTDTFSKQLEQKIDDVLMPYRYMVKSVITKVGTGAGDPQDIGSNQGDSPNKARLTVNFKDFQARNGQSTSEILEAIRTDLTGFPGVHVVVEKDRAGPPVGKPISLEIAGEKMSGILNVAERVLTAIQTADIQGIEGIKIDPRRSKPELIVHIDQEKARRHGLSTLSIANEIRTSLFGKEVSKYKQGEEEYSVNLRLRHDYRKDIQALLNKNIVFRNQSNGRLVQVPISSVAKVRYEKTYNQVNRKDLKRVVTLSSNVIGGYNPTIINTQIREVLNGVEVPAGYEFRFGGEQEKQAEEMSFLFRAFIFALAMIFFVIVIQFNNLTTPIIIMTTVGFSVIGVLLGLVSFQMDFVVIMTMVGIISLAGVVVNNGIVLLDFVEQHQRQQEATSGVKRLPFEGVVESIVAAGKARLRPVLLTAITTVLGLVPLAVGLNVDFFGLLSNYDPNFYVGGDNVSFWGPMSWAIIFGLTFATFLTLVIVPVMYWFFTYLKYKWNKWE